MNMAYYIYSINYVLEGSSMPIYEYRCEACGEAFSLLQKMGAGAKDTVCPHCGSANVQKQFSTCAVGGGSTGGAPACSSGGG